MVNRADRIARLLARIAEVERTFQELGAHANGINPLSPSQLYYRAQRIRHRITELQEALDELVGKIEKNPGNVVDEEPFLRAAQGFDVFYGDAMGVIDATMAQNIPPAIGQNQFVPAPAMGQNTVMATGISYQTQMATGVPPTNYFTAEVPVGLGNLSIQPQQVRQQVRTSTPVDSLIDIDKKAREQFDNVLPSSPESSRSSQRSHRDQGPQIVIAKREARVHVPDFDGTPEKWLSFYSAFKEGYANDKTRTDLERMSALKKAVKGKAALYLDQYDTIGEVFEEAWKKLQEAFGRPELLVEGMKRKLKAIPQATDKAESIEETTYRINSLVSMIIRADKSYQDSHDLMALVKTKWPKIIVDKLAYERHVNHGGAQYSIEAAIEKVLVMARGLAESEETEKETKVSRPPSSSTSRGFTHNQAYKKPVTSVPIQNQEGDNQAVRCSFCGEQGHPPDQCTVVVSHANRRQVMEQQRLCYRCLKKNHVAAYCNYLCKKCQRPHHEAMCYANRQQTHIVKSATGSEPNCFLVGTIRCKNGANGKVVRLTAMLDTASSMTYVSKAALRKLNIKSEEPQSVVVTGLAGGTVSFHSSKANFKVVTDDGEIDIQGLSIKEVTGSPVIVTQKESAHYKKAVEVDVLLSVHYTVKLMKGVVEKDANGLLTQHTSVGTFTLPEHPNFFDPTQTNMFCLIRPTGTVNELDILEQAYLGNKSNDAQPVKLEEPIRLPDGRYEVKIPWKSEHPRIHPNFGSAAGQLRSSHGRMQKSPGILQQYHEIFQNQEAADIIEKVPPHSGGEITHYLPHHPVVKASSSTTKVRIVFNCAAKTPEGNCLNDMIHQGPDLLPKLRSILLKIRGAKFFVACDIEKAFHQISVSPKDRDALRFLWVRDPNLPPTRRNIQAYRFKQLIFGMNCSPALLGITLHVHMRGHPDEIVMVTTYVDNVFILDDDPELLDQRRRRVQLHFEDGKFHLREFFSNKGSLLEGIKETADEARLKILGIGYDAKTDVFRTNIAIDAKRCKNTKEVHSAILSVFDPIGFVTPVTALLKSFARQHGIFSHERSVPLGSELAKAWEDVVQLVNGEVTVPRYAISKGGGELHVFADASGEFVAAAAYFKPDTGEPPALIMSKSVFKARSTTIPKAELQALVMAAELALEIEQTGPKFREICLWSDSTIALDWVKKPSHDLFVLNRVKKLLAMPIAFSFGHVASEDNPADLPTRGTSMRSLGKLELWWHGPPWLRSGECPKIFSNVAPPKIVHAMTLACTIAQQQNQAQPFISVENFSNYRRLIRVTRMVIQNSRRWVTRMGTIQLKFPVLGDGEAWHEAERFLIRQEQQRYDVIPTSDNALIKGPDGVVHFNDRIRHGPRLPVLPRHSHLTTLYVRQVHEQLAHCGTATTLTAIREHFWILRGRATVRSILKTCTRCRQQHAGPYEMPLFPPLPSKRTELTRPYAHIGVDFFGPLRVIDKDGLKTSTVVLIITCLTTRAIQLQRTPTMSAPDVLETLYRHSTRFGFPSTVLSDNALSFRKVAEFVTQDPAFHGVRWSHTIERAPWQGAVYERLIGIVKNCMHRTFGRKLPYLSEIDHHLGTIEAAVNCRPLVPLDDDTTVTLRPCDFFPATDRILPGMQASQPPVAAPGPEVLSQLWRKQQEDSSQAAELFMTAYLNHLRERTQWIHRSGRIRNKYEPLVGETVVIRDDGPRHLWRLGLIQQLIASQDGVNRAAVVKTSTGQLTRPLNHLYALESRQQV